MNKNQIKRDIFKTLNKEVKESFEIIPKSNDIRRILKEQEYPFSFEVPFVLDDDLSMIIDEINKQLGYGGIAKDSYILSFKDNSNSLIVRSINRETNDILISTINNVQVFGPDGNNKYPLGTQEEEPEQDETLSSQIAITLEKNPELCPVCNSLETKLMGESIHWCLECSTLFEGKQVREDMLIDPKDIKDKEDEKIAKDKLNEDGEGGGAVSAGVTTSGTTTTDMAEIPTGFTNGKINKKPLKMNSKIAGM